MQSLENLRPYVQNQIFKLETVGGDVFQNLHLDYEGKVYRERELGRLIKDSVEYFALTPNEFEDFSSSGNLIEARRTAWGRISEARKNKKGDYGELLLFLALYFFYPASPQRFVTKVRLRSSVKEQIKGFDCAHFTIENDDVCLWLGEAKFHNSISNAIADAFKSIEDHLQLDYLRGEFKILGSNIEANRGISPEYLKKLQAVFKGRSINSVKIKIPVLLTYDCKVVGGNDSVSDIFRDELRGNLEKLKTRISAKVPVLPDNVSLVFILFPFKSVDVVKSYLETAEDVMK